MTQQEFIKGATDADNHRLLLWLALELTKENKSPVVEFGAGTGSTPFLREYCYRNNREFKTYDSNKEWAEKWQSVYTTDWLSPYLYKKYSVVLIDQAPGEYRHKSIELLKDSVDVIVVHDAEPEPRHGYRLEEIWHLFKYRVFTKGDKIWTASVSNTINLNEYENELIGNFKIEL